MVRACANDAVAATTPDPTSAVGPAVVLTWTRKTSTRESLANLSAVRIKNNINNNNKTLDFEIIIIILAVTVFTIDRSKIGERERESVYVCVCVCVID